MVQEPDLFVACAHKIQTLQIKMEQHSPHILKFPLIKESDRVGRKPNHASFLTEQLLNVEPVIPINFAVPAPSATS
jgi:hypothetical protein